MNSQDWRLCLHSLANHPLLRRDLVAKPFRPLRPATRAPSGEIRIHIDERKKDRQVAEIAGSDYFRNLQLRAREMRTKVKRPA